MVYVDTLQDSQSFLTELRTFMPRACPAIRDTRPETGHITLGVMPHDFRRSCSLSWEELIEMAFGQVDAEMVLGIEAVRMEGMSRQERWARLRDCGRAIFLL